MGVGLLAGCVGDLSAPKPPPGAPLLAPATPHPAVAPPLELLVDEPRRGDVEDGYPLRRYRVSLAGRVRDLGLAHEARRFGRGVALVRAGGDLVLLPDLGGAELLLAHQVAPELVVDAAGERLGFVRREAEGERLFLLTANRLARPLSSFHKHLDRLLFVDGEHLLFVASPPAHLPGLFLLRVGEAERQLTNHGLRAGAGLPPDFVPLPVDGRAMRLDGGALRYCDGEQGWRIDLAPWLGPRLGPRLGLALARAPIAPDPAACTGWRP